MKYNVLTYLIGEGFANVFKNKKQAFTSIGMMCVTMLIFGIFFVLGENLNHFVEEIEQEQGLQVFMTTDPDPTDEEIEKLKQELLAMNGVNTVEFVSKSDAYETLKNSMGEERLEGFEEDLLPVSYIVTLTDLSLSSQIQEQISALDNVDSIESSNETMNVLVKIARGIRIGTYVILVCLIIFAVFIITNTIKLTVHARRREISIMKYVGATNSFIRWPFLVEGVLIGVAAGILSVAIIGVAYTYIAGKLSGAIFLEMANWRLIEFKDMFNLILTVYLALGIGIGMVGSGISMRKYLDV